MGRTGKLTPLASLEPVELCGATVSRATLNNYGDIVRKKVKKGSRVFVRRSNDVIPEILGVAEDNGGTEITKARSLSCLRREACGGRGASFLSQRKRLPRRKSRAESSILCPKTVWTFAA